MSGQVDSGSGEMSPAAAGRYIEAYIPSSCGCDVDPIPIALFAPDSSDGATDFAVDPTAKAELSQLTWSPWRRVLTHPEGCNLLGVVATGNAHFELFAKRGRQLRKIVFDGGSWSDWIELSSNVYRYTREPHVVHVGDNRIWIFFHGETEREAVYFESMVGPSRVFTGPHTLGGLPQQYGPVVAASWFPGRVDIVTRNLNPPFWGHRTYHRGRWSDWSENMAPPSSSPPLDGLPRSMTTDTSGRLFVVTHDWYRLYEGGMWGRWERFDGGGQSIKVISSGRNTFDVIRSTREQLLEYGRFSNGRWSGWTSLGGVRIMDPVAVSIGGGEIEVFACTGGEDGLTEVWQISGR